jgi:hypothetical protein
MSQHKKTNEGSWELTYLDKEETEGCGRAAKYLLLLAARQPLGALVSCDAA